MTRKIEQADSTIVVMTIIFIIIIIIIAIAWECNHAGIV